MKLFKLLLTGFFAISLISVNAQEHEPKSTAEEKATAMTESMKDHFSLEEGQVTQLKSINLEFMNTMMDMKSNSDMSRDERMEIVENASAKRKEGIKGVLSEEDFVKFEEKEAEKKAMMRKKRQAMNSPEKRAAHHTEKMNEMLELTDAQLERVSKLNLMVENKIEVIKKDELMNDEKKKEFIHGNRKDQMNALKSILTPEQFTKLEEAKEGKGDHDHGGHNHGDHK